MTYEEFYGSFYEKMKRTEKQLCEMVTLYINTKSENEGIKPVIYFCSRIKTPDSMLEKLKLRGHPQTILAAINDVYDGIGLRVVCPFAEDIYRFIKWLRLQAAFTIDIEKDYYSYPKPNGYRSYHLLIQMNNEDRLRAEIQVRTIANDFWATLEHQLKYKKNIENEKTIRKELKRCADEIASLDMSMQTIRDIIRNGIDP